MKVTNLAIVDVAEQARQMFGKDAADEIAGRKLPEYDYRFEADTLTGGRVTFSADATAQYVIEYLSRDIKS